MGHRIRTTRKTRARYLAHLIAQATYTQVVPCDSENFVGNGYVLSFADALPSLRHEWAQILKKRRFANLVSRYRILNKELCGGSTPVYRERAIQIRKEMTQLLKKSPKLRLTLATN